MKKLFITALFAILMGGFALTANAQPGTESKTDGKTTELKEAPQAPKLSNQDNKKSLQTQDYQKMIEEYTAAVDEFVNAYKEVSEQNATAKAKPVDLQKLLKDAEGKEGKIEVISDKLSPAQKKTFEKQKARLTEVKDKFLKKKK